MIRMHLHREVPSLLSHSVVFGFAATMTLLLAQGFAQAPATASNSTKSSTARTGAARPAQIKVIRNVTVIDVVTGQTIAQQDVWISGDKIQRVTKAGQPPAPRSAKVLDGTGKFLIPGLWDMHSHLRRRREPSLDKRLIEELEFPLLVANGITGVRDMGTGSLERFAPVSEAIKDVASGTLIGPRVVTPICKIDGPRKPPVSDRWSVATPAEVDTAVDTLWRHHADFIKPYSGLSQSLYLELGKQARVRNLPLAGHLPLAATLDDVIAAGQHDIEHVYELLPFSSNYPIEYDQAVQKAVETTETNKILGSKFARLRAAYSGFASLKAQHLASTLADHQIWIGPTLGITERKLTFVAEQFQRGPLYEYVPEFQFNNWRAIPWDKSLESLIADAARKLIAVFISNGVSVLAGTDPFLDQPGCVDGFSLHEELQLLVQAGATNLQALQSATLNPALYLKDSSFGTITPGSRADLILLDSNPLTEIRNTSQINSVILHGMVLTRPDLDLMLSGVRRFVQQTRNAPEWNL